MSDPMLTDLLASYVPRLIQNRIVVDPAPIEAPVSEEFQAAVLFADISGFTRLTEGLAERGPQGVETLARILNEYFGQLIDIVHRIWRGCGQVRGRCRDRHLEHRARPDHSRLRLWDACSHHPGRPVAMDHARCRMCAGHPPAPLQLQGGRHHPLS